MRITNTNVKNIEHLKLKLMLLEIDNYYLDKQITLEMITEIQNKYKQAFELFGLGDLQFTVGLGRQIGRHKSIIIVPTREIDRYAIIGILSN